MGNRTIVACCALLAACGGAPEPAARPAAAAASDAPKLVTMIRPSLLVPELDAREIEPWFREHGRAKYLVGGMRILQHDDGRVERAEARFPTGDVKALPLPDRLGGGFLFYQADPQGTRLWRAASWTGSLVPLAHLSPTITEVVPGFDRLYLRTTTNRLLALEAEDGRLLPLGPLPPAAGYGAMAFADGWRAVVDTDLRGPMASFDAGASWVALPVASNVINAAVEDGDPVLYVDGGTYRIDAAGHLQLVDHASAPPDEELGEREEDSVRDDHPLGERPLRTAIERGFPDSQQSAMVAYRGALVRVRLPDAAVLAVNPKAFDGREATCTAAPVGRGFGFICGGPAEDTVIYAFEAPLSLREVVRFAGPRFVSPSGNGALVVRGRCAQAAGGTPADDLRMYCLVGADGQRREIAVRGELGAERVVALSDGRAVVLVPPRLGEPGKLTIIDGDKLTAHVLRYPGDRAKAVAVARRGLWLDGFEQRHPDRIGGWVEAGGPAVGVEVSLDGKVHLGEVFEEPGDLLFSGRFALAVGRSEGAHESIDGGMHWRELELPGLPESTGDAKSRACSRLGCALRGWLRVGWGRSKVDKDLRSAPAVEAVGVSAKAGAAIALRCQALSGPEQSGQPAPSWRDGSWDPFLGVPAPRLGKDELGVDRAAQAYAEIPTHVYAWGPKGADWTRAGWWQIRFEDPFDPRGGVRSSAPTRPPWGDEVTAGEAIGSRRHGSYWRWEALLEPSGRAALVSHCTGSGCTPHAVTEGRPILPLRSPQGGQPLFRKPLADGVARIGEVWYLLTAESAAAPLALWRADLGVLRQVAVYRRLDPRHYPVQVAPKLVRRALAGELGLLITVPPDLSSGLQVGEWVVLPIDAATAELGEPVRLGSADLGGRLPPRCGEHHDGWLLDTKLPISPAVHLENAVGYIDDIELRLRIDPGGVCVEAMSAKAGRGFRLQDPKAEPTSSAQAIPLAARERYAGQRWHLSCR